MTIKLDLNSQRKKPELKLPTQPRQLNLLTTGMFDPNKANALPAEKQTLPEDEAGIGYDYKNPEYNDPDYIEHRPFGCLQMCFNPILRMCASVCEKSATFMKFYSSDREYRLVDQKQTQVSDTVSNKNPLYQPNANKFVIK